MRIEISYFTRIDRIILTGGRYPIHPISYFFMYEYIDSESSVIDNISNAIAFQGYMEFIWPLKWEMKAGH